MKKINILIILLVSYYAHAAEKGLNPNLAQEPASLKQLTTEAAARYSMPITQETLPVPELRSPVEKIRRELTNKLITAIQFPDAVFPIREDVEDRDEELYEHFRDLLARGADPNLQDPQSGDLVLHTAIAHQSMPAIRALIQVKADVNRRNTGFLKLTPLEAAVRERQQNMVTHLPDNGANPHNIDLDNIKNENIRRLIEKNRAQ